LTIYIALVRILHSAELNQIAGALEIPAKVMYDHRFSRWFFFLEVIIFHQKSPIVI